MQVKGCIGTDCDTASATIQRFPAPIVARIAGGNRNAGKDSAMTFDCSESFWPDGKRSDLVYSWSIDKVGAATGESPSVTVELLRAGFLVLPAGFLAVGTYAVKCSVTTSSAGVEAAAYSVAVTVEAKEVPLVAVGTFENEAPKYGATSKIRLNSTVSLESDPDAKFALTWSCSPSVDLASTLVTTTGANQPNLVVRSNVLQAGVVYTFQLSAAYPGQDPGTSTLDVAISTPPRGGKIVVTPATGFELDTEFEISAPHWVGDGNLFYTYVAESTEEGITTRAILGHGQKKTTLGGIILNRGNLKLNVIVADAFGAEGRAITSLNVKAKAVTAAVADNLIAAAVGAGKSGKVTDAVGKIDSLFKALNKKPVTANETGVISEEKIAELTQAGIDALGQALESITASNEGVEQVAGALNSIAGDDSGTLSEDSTKEATALVGKNIELMKSLADPPTKNAALNTLSVIGTLCASTAATSNGEAVRGERRLSEAGKDGDGNNGSGEAPRSKEALQFETLRAGITALGDATLKGSLDGEEAVNVVSRNVQSSASRASGAGLAGQTFGAAQGPTKLELPTALSTAGSVIVKIAVIDVSINTYGADSDVAPETALVSVKLTDSSGQNVAKHGTIAQGDPLVLLVPVPERTAPKPCGTAGTVSCENLGALGLCESRNATCNRRGDCVNGQCFCDLPYMGFNCSEAVGCNYWDDEARAWSSEGCLSKGVSEVNGCSQGGESSTDEASSGDAPSFTCAYALRCECTHLTDFAGIAIPTSLDEVLAQLEPTITLPCPDGFFAPFDFMKSPFLYSLIKGLTLMNLISIAFFRWRSRAASLITTPTPSPASTPSFFILTMQVHAEVSGQGAAMDENVPSDQDSHVRTNLIFGSSPRSSPQPQAGRPSRRCQTYGHAQA